MVLRFSYSCLKCELENGLGSSTAFLALSSSAMHSEKRAARSAHPPSWHRTMRAQSASGHPDRFGHRATTLATGRLAGSSRAIAYAAPPLQRRRAWRLARSSTFGSSGSKRLFSLPMMAISLIPSHGMDRVTTSKPTLRSRPQRTHTRRSLSCVGPTTFRGPSNGASPPVLRETHAFAPSLPLWRAQNRRSWP